MAWRQPMNVFIWIVVVFALCHGGHSHGLPHRILHPNTVPLSWSMLEPALLTHSRTFQARELTSPGGMSSQGKATMHPSSTVALKESQVKK